MSDQSASAIFALVGIAVGHGLRPHHPGAAQILAVDPVHQGGDPGDDQAVFARA